MNAYAILETLNLNSTDLISYANANVTQMLTHTVIVETQLKTGRSINSNFQRVYRNCYTTCRVTASNLPEEPAKLGMLIL